MAAITETKECIGCGARFARDPKDKPYRWKQRRYCSRACWGDSQRGVRKNRVQEVAECDACGRTFWRPVGGPQTYCRDPECQSKRLLARLPDDARRAAEERIAELELPRLIEEQEYDMRWGYRVDRPAAFLPDDFFDVYEVIAEEMYVAMRIRRSIKPKRRPKVRFRQDQSRVRAA